jgi:hypothetical protein
VRLEGGGSPAISPGISPGSVSSGSPGTTNNLFVSITGSRGGDGNGANTIASGSEERCGIDEFIGEGLLFMIFDILEK